MKINKHPLDYSHCTKNSNNETNSRVWRWNDRMRRVSKAERQLRKSARHPTEKENNAFPQLRWPSKPWNSGAEKLISKDWAVPVNWVKVSQVLPLWYNTKRTVTLPRYEIRDSGACLLVYLYLFLNLFKISSVLFCYSFVWALLRKGGIKLFSVWLLVWVVVVVADVQ